jgi:hypothetical protein
MGVRDEPLGGDKMKQTLEKIEQQIAQLETKRDDIKEDEFIQAANNWFTLLHVPYETSEQYIIFCRVFKKQFKKLLNDNFNIAKIEISKPNHYDQTGFFELCNGNIYYFSIGDLRWDKTFLIRTARHFEDYTGGSNDYCNTKDIEQFMTDLRRIVQ